MPSLSPLLALAALAAVAGCTPTPPPPPQPVVPLQVHADFDRTWNAVIDAFAELNVPIANMEKASGFIASSRMAIPLRGAEKLADCGTIGTLPIKPDHLVYNVRVRRDSATATRSYVYVATFFTENDEDTHIECTSKGSVEAALWQRIAEHAEASVAGGAH